jgi:hypothetical protein
MFWHFREEIRETLKPMTAIALTRQTFKTILYNSLVIHNDLKVVLFRNEEFKIQDIK